MQRFNFLAVIQRLKKGDLAKCSSFCRISSLNLCESDVESLLRSLKMHSFLKLMFTEHLFFFYQITIPACPPCEVKSVEKLVAQSCPTLCNPMDCSPPDSSVHGILQARILEWVAIPFFKESSQTRDRTRVFCIAGKILYHLSHLGGIMERGGLKLGAWK